LTGYFTARFARGAESAEKLIFLICPDKIGTNQNHQSCFQQEKMNKQNLVTDFKYFNQDTPEGMLFFLSALSAERKRK
jgi:hypothetical protein